MAQINRRMLFGRSIVYLHPFNAGVELTQINEATNLSSLGIDVSDSTWLTGTTPRLQRFTRGSTPSHHAMPKARAANENLLRMSVPSRVQYRSWLCRFSGSGTGTFGSQVAPAEHLNLVNLNLERGDKSKTPSTATDRCIP